MTHPRVRYDKKDHVAYVTLDRPEVLNALDLATHEQLRTVWDEVETDDDVRAVVLTGEGDRAFCVGQDLKERARLAADGAPPTTFGSRGLPGWPRFTERFTLTKPVIARVHGYALGGGFELPLACDIIIASEQAVAGWADDLVRSAPLSVRAIKEAVLKSVDMPLDQAFATRYFWEEQRVQSKDTVEGLRAFAEKRQPVWSGH
jgi:enoyl-CoA hydratase/carnithine racemase